MIELPEALTLAHQLQEAVTGQSVCRVFPPTKPHKFCWFQGDPAGYERQIQSSYVSAAKGFGIYVELEFDNGKRLCWNDGVHARLVSEADLPKDYQLLITLSGGQCLVFTVAMYGGILLHDADFDEEYYVKSRDALSPFSPEFEAYFESVCNACKPDTSAKALLATQQRFPGIGNGVVQDILFSAGIHPKRKLKTLSEAQRKRLCACIPAVLREMLDRGGRDTEKDLYANSGTYHTRMSRNTLKTGCPQCGNPVLKETYLGGAVYSCAVCQPLED